MQLLHSEQHVQWSPSSGSGDLPMHLVEARQSLPMVPMASATCLCTSAWPPSYCADAMVHIRALQRPSTHQINVVAWIVSDERSFISQPPSARHALQPTAPHQPICAPKFPPMPSASVGLSQLPRSKCTGLGSACGAEGGKVWQVMHSRHVGCCDGKYTIRPFMLG